MIRTLIEQSRLACARNYDMPALLAPHREALRYGDLPRVLARIAEQLPAEAIVATVLPPGPDAVLVVLASMWSGVVMPLSPDATAIEIAATLDRIRPDLIVTVDGLLADVVSIGRSKRISVAVMSTNRAIGSIALDVTLGQRHVPIALPDGARMLLQTSGTTSQPKVVPLTEQNLMAAADALVRSIGLGPGDRALNLLPQYHVGGVWDLVAGPLLVGGSVICGGAFSRRAFAEGLKLEPTWTQLAPPMIADLVADPEQGALGLRLIRSVSAALPATLRRTAEERLRVPLVEIYGMTETAGVITSQALDHQDETVGRPVGVKVTIRDGEIVVQGPQVSPGYLMAAPHEGNFFGPGGFRTGDLGSIDSEGRLSITGRVKDLINRGGEMVAPAEIEEAMRSLPWITDVAVYGVPHPVLGEEIAAAIVRSGGPEDVMGEVRKAVRRVLGHGRMPAEVHVVASLPRSASGKLLRRALSGWACETSVPMAASGELTPLGEWVARIWAEALGLPWIGSGEDFFLLGGTSLHAAQAIALMQDRFPDALLYVSSLYDASTPAAFEAFLRENYPEIRAAILRDRVIARPTVPPVTDLEISTFEAALRCPPPPVRTGPPNARAVFILSAPRSGSTLLRVMMAGHTALFAPPELYLLSHRDLAARKAWFGRSFASQLEGLARAVMAATGMEAAAAIAAMRRAEDAALPVYDVYRELQSLVAPRLLVDKTPFYAVHPETLAAAEAIFPDAIYIHLTRHPYGMIRSFEKAHLDQLWWPRLTGPEGPRLTFHTRQLAEMLWTRIAATTTTFLQAIPKSRQIHVRYEDLVSDPEGELRKICHVLGIEFEPAMSSPHAPEGERMTDGLHAGSRMIGDPNFHRHSGVSKTGVDAWSKELKADFLSARTWFHAHQLRHSEKADRGEENLSYEL